MTEQVVIATDLAAGRVVFLEADGGWSPFIANSAFAANDAEADALLDIAKVSERRQEIVDPYLIEITRDGGLLRPNRFRELIRAMGPTVGSTSVARRSFLPVGD